MKITLTDKNGNQVLAVESSPVIKNEGNEISTNELKLAIKNINISSFKTQNVKVSKLSIVNEKYVCETADTVYVEFDINKIVNTVGDEIVELTNKIVDILNKTDIGKKLLFIKLTKDDGFYIYDNIAEHESDSYDACIPRKNVNLLKLEVNKTIKEKLDIVHSNQKKYVDDILNSLSKFGIRPNGSARIKKHISTGDEYYDYIFNVSGLSKYLEIDKENVDYVTWPVKGNDGYFVWKHDPNESYAPVKFAKHSKLDKISSQGMKKLELPNGFDGINVGYNIYFDFGENSCCWIKHKRSIDELIKLNGSEKFLKGIRNSVKDFDTGILIISLNIEYDV